MWPRKLQTARDFFLKWTRKKPEKKPKKVPKNVFSVNFDFLGQENKRYWSLSSSRGFCPFVFCGLVDVMAKIVYFS